jgi:excisionase family DNA binding protein
VIHQLPGMTTGSKDDMSTDTISSPDTNTNHTASTPWLTVEEAADRARCGVKTMYREVKAGRLKAARVGGRRDLRLLPEWVDQWLLDSTRPRVA